VVLVLMGIVLSMMTLTVGDGGKYRELEEESLRLKTLINMAREEVIMQSQEWRIAFKEDGYQFERVNDIKDLVSPDEKDNEETAEDKDKDEGTSEVNWIPIDHKIFRVRELPGYHLSVIIEDEEYKANSEEEEEVDEGIIGLVHMYYSGEMMAFELTIEQEEGDDKFILKASPFGELELKSSRDDEV